MNLTVNLPSQGLGVSLSWESGFSLQGEEVTFIITSIEIASGATTESRSNISSATLIPPSTGNTCQYRFIIQSENDYSRSTMEISVESVIPTGEWS